jgi:bifunctional non-homologous end joining protein LigD
MGPMLKPMLASIGEAPLVDAHFVYEPKYDGIRAIAEIGRDGRVRLWSRLGNEKTDQFPEVAAALTTWARRRTLPIVLDGEIVALDARGAPTGFQQLQRRGQLRLSDDPAGGHVAFIVFDLLLAGSIDLRAQALIKRRLALERLMASLVRRESSPLRLGEQVAGDGRALYEQVVARGWEGLIAKRADSRYQSGKRTTDWRKLKIVKTQEFVIGGWTESRQTRGDLGALLLGVFEGTQLIYTGHVGSGFDEQERTHVLARLRPLETAASPFASPLKTNERPHWARPVLVAQIKFTEWTTDGKLRHPVYLGLRDDKRALDVRKETSEHLHATAADRLRTGAAGRQAAAEGAIGPDRGRRGARAVEIATNGTAIEPLIARLREMEAARQDGTLDLGDGCSVRVTNLRKPFWPQLGVTKGDLFRYYLEVSPYLLPTIADRPLVMKRMPNGVHGAPFYQQRAIDVPPGVRVERVTASKTDPARTHIIGGDLLTLLYTTQLAAISQDPWFSRVGTLASADFAAIDLDPSDGVSFRQVLDVARAVHDELYAMGVPSVPKTSGASGLHIYVPLPPATPYEAGLLFCQIVATLVAHKHPTIATVERAVQKRGRRVYVDYLQNIRGKTLASAYSARASEYAGVSTPVTWSEIEAGIDREDFTIRTVPDRLKRTGDLWAALRTAKGADLARAARYGA